MADEDRRVFQVDGRGFDGELVIEGGAGGHVRISGTREPGEVAVAKDVPADRDPRLADLVSRCLDGDAAAPGALLAHLGVLDPEP